MFRYVIATLSIVDEEGNTQLINQYDRSWITLKLGPMEESDDAELWLENMFIMLRTLAMSASLPFSEE